MIDMTLKDAFTLLELEQNGIRHLNDVERVYCLKKILTKKAYIEMAFDLSDKELNLNSITVFKAKNNSFLDEMYEKTINDASHAREQSRKPLIKSINK